MKKAIRMKKKNILLLSIAGLWTMAGFAQAAKDSARIARNLTIDEVVVTGTRNETDIRHLPMTISVVNRKVLERRFQPSVLPALTEQVPGLFATSRGIMGYGVSTGAAGGMNLRGIGGSTILGSGEVALILDVAALVNLVAHGEEERLLPNRPALTSSAISTAPTASLPGR